jgi:hypothetical protein
VADIGAKVNAAMREIEKHNPQLAGVLPKTYNLFTSTLLKELLKKVSEIPATLDYDAFGRIYEYFLGEFAMTEGQGGGEFYTPSSIVKLLAEIIEPFHGRILDPACGSGGMFVQSARFVAEHQKNPAAELAICGVEKTDETGRLCRLNLAVHGLEGDIATAATSTATTTTRTPPPASSTSSSPIHPSTSMRWTRSGSRTWSAPAAASPSACRAPTTPTTCGFSSSTRRSMPPAAPASSWPTRPPMPARPSRNCGRS